MLPSPKDGRREELVAAARRVHRGGIIAYPCEAVYGLGCDPRKETAIQRLLDIKRRPPDKGLILIADDIERLRPYCQPIPRQRWHAVLSSWPGPYTWLFPAKKTCLSLLTGGRSTIAVRLSADPLMRRLCRLCGHALISTSANRSRQEPARSSEDVLREFGDEIDFVVSGRIKGEGKPTSIRDALSGEVVRP